MSISYNPGKVAITVNTVADLATARVSDGDIVTTLGYTTVGIGGNTYRYNSNSATTVNYGAVLDGPGSIGRYIATSDIFTFEQFGAIGDDLTDDSVAMQRAIDACSLLNGRTGATYKTTTALIIDHPVEIDFRFATLKMSPSGAAPTNRHIRIASELTQAGAGWTEAVTAGQVSFTANISAVTLPAGTDIILYLGQSPYDSNEQHIVQHCRVLSNNGTTLVIDKPIPIDINQGAFNHEVWTFDSEAHSVIIKNLLVANGTGITDRAISIETARNVTIENITGSTNSLVNVADSANIRVHNCHVRLDGDAHSTSGRLFTAWNSENLELGTNSVTNDGENCVVLLENFARQFKSSQIAVTLPDPDSAQEGVFHITGGSYNIDLGDIILSSNGTTAGLVTNGSIPTRYRVGSLAFEGTSLGIDMASIGRFRRNGLDFCVRRQIRRTIELTDGMAGVNFELGRGVLVDLQLYPSDLTGVTNVHLRDGNETGLDIISSLTAGRWNNYDNASNFGSNYAFNDSVSNNINELKKLKLVTSTVTPGATIKVVATILGLEDITSKTFTAATNDELTIAYHLFRNGDQVKCTSTGTLPSGLSSATTYYAVERTTNTLKLSLTSSGAAVDILNTGSGTHTLHHNIFLRYDD